MLDSHISEAIPDVRGKQAGDGVFVRPHTVERLLSKDGIVLCQRGDSAPVVVGYDKTYTDSEGRSVGDEGFVPPMVDGKQSTPLSAGCYDSHYIDDNGRKAGERGFIPPVRGVVDADKISSKLTGTSTGYDSEYRDEQGRAPQGKTLTFVCLLF